MPWAVAAAAVGVAGSVYSSNKASKGQQAAADAAAAGQDAQYAQTRNDNLPALEARNNALAQMQNLATKYGGGVPSAADVMATPGYKFGLDQGTNAVQGGAAAQGGLYSGAAGKALARYGTDYATTKYDDSFNRLQTAQTNDFNRYASISGQGQTGANQIAQAGQNNVNAQTGLLTGNANAQGAAVIAQGNAIQNGVNQAGSALKGWWEQPAAKNPYTTPDASGAYQNPTTGNGGYNWTTGDEGRPRAWADGGAVRREPVIGSRTPLPVGGTGGGMSPNALMLVVQPDGSYAVAPQGMGSLPANPLMNPRAIAEARMRSAGAYAGGGAVHGPGGPKDDAIPVTMDDGGIGHLSNDEHVLTQRAVKGAGHGNVQRGHQKLNRLQTMLERRN